MGYFNGELKKKLKEKFYDKGIVAYSGCCRWGCTGSYGGDGQEDFNDRKNGIYYIRLHLDGMNYEEEVNNCYASYCSENGNDHQYLMDHWDEECEIIHDFCYILGIPKNEYQISKPKDITKKIGIHFNQPLKLEKVPEDDDD